eukprot:5535619-Alexandrium_andersonii.AAC.1
MSALLTPMLLTGSTSWSPWAIRSNAATPRSILSCTRRGNCASFPGMLSRDPAQDRRAERGWVDSCVGRE